jgi:hypothetical protein
MILKLSSFLRIVDQECVTKNPDPSSRAYYFLTKALPNLAYNMIPSIRSKYQIYLEQKDKLKYVFDSSALEQLIVKKYFNQGSYLGSLGYCDCQSFYNYAITDPKLSQYEKDILKNFLKYK